MHVPNPLGKYPLVLRDYSIEDSRRGELLMDYTTNKIYYRNLISGETIDIAKSIYDKIIAAKLENSKIAPVKTSTLVTSDVPVIPTPENRVMNTWYMNIYKKIDVEVSE